MIPLPLLVQVAKCVKIGLPELVLLAFLLSDNRFLKEHRMNGAANSYNLQIGEVRADSD
ncbi:hypothetical protein SASPL_129627 [Salvia splendens]|uniref:Uncharacterized protein n=1 Tax=Salvia splendens TaxID=180675 RepID=A0A8X8XES8_SALSN|nr:hypothetical protein SASPL_129627 [Salvia splendens]